MKKIKKCLDNNIKIYTKSKIMFNPRPECTRYNNPISKRDIHLADRALASTQNMNFQQEQTLPEPLITSPTFTMGEKGYSISQQINFDRGGINTRIQKSLNNQETNQYYQMGRIGASAEKMIDITRPIDTRLQVKESLNINKREPMTKNMPYKF
jgi:hypothetical protein